jgi:hypothetical protein
MRTVDFSACFGQPIQRLPQSFGESSRYCSSPEVVEYTKRLFITRCSPSITLTLLRSAGSLRDIRSIRKTVPSGTRGIGSTLYSTCFGKSVKTKNVRTLPPGASEANPSPSRVRLFPFSVSSWDHYEARLGTYIAHAERATFISRTDFTTSATVFNTAYSYSDFVSVREAKEGSEGKKKGRKKIFPRTGYGENPG